MGARNAIHGVTLIVRTMTIMQSREPKRTSAERQKWQKATITEPQSAVSGGEQREMGTDSDKPTLLINGVDYTDCIQTIAEHRLKAISLAVWSVKLDGSAPLDGNLFLQNLERMKITFSVKRVSRKRLVKLLMARGHSRNAANCIARSWGWNYAKNYLRYAITRELF